MKGGGAVRTKYGLNNKTKKVEKIRQVYLQNMVDKTSREARSLRGGDRIFSYQSFLVKGSIIFFLAPFFPPIFNPLFFPTAILPEIKSKHNQTIH